ncbi:olfactory receptor-like protein I9 [Anomaloglossus baeobatrachus]|uniref:olfactory receptor-like protein I9 n=1 Tax=Anomaloglossus baeobatrachus TaxID=238106 RepID=UPI003F502F2E
MEQTTIYKEMPEGDIIGGEVVRGVIMDLVEYRAVNKLLFLKGRRPKETFYERKKVYGDDSPLYDVVKNWHHHFNCVQASVETAPIPRWNLGQRKFALLQHVFDANEKLIFPIPAIAIMENNLTGVKEFFLLGFQGSENVRKFLFFLLLLAYSVTICGNLLIITLVSTSENLHTPMYFFISQLSISDILLPTDIVPNLLHILLNNGATITFIGCMAQLYFFCIAEASESLLLTVMSYDRYVAICNPLHYVSIMTGTLCVKLVVTFWLLSFFVSFIYIIIIISGLKFCGTNIIDHLFCDLVPLQDIACSDTFPIKVQIYLLSIPLVGIPNLIIIISYINIVRAVLQIQSNVSRQKAFSTCSSHLTVVSIFYLSLSSVYILPKRGKTSDINKFLSLLYIVLTPLINPIIYSFRNRDVKKAMQEINLKSLTNFTCP